jgi:hypothetical protein
MDTIAAPIEEPALHDHVGHGAERSCQQCGITFKPRRSTAKFCSTTCRVRAHRDAKISVTTQGRLNPAPEPLLRLETNPRPIEGHSRAQSRAALFVLGDVGQEPRFIESRYSGKVYPRTYLEHGLRYPDHLRVKPR